MKSRSKAASHSCGLLVALLALAFLSSPLCAQDPQVNFTLRGQWPGFPRGRASDVAVLGQYAYVSLADTRSFLIMDISNPAQPVWLKNFDSGADFDSGGACYFATESNRVYVTRDEAGLAILDVTQPLNPVRLGVLQSGYSSAKYPNGIQVLGDFAYLMFRNQDSSYHGLDVVDIHNPAQPVRTGSLEIPAWICDFRVSGKHAYVATGDGLWIVDVSNPLQPVLAGSYETNRWFLGIAVSGNYAYVAMKDVGLVVLDVSKPVNPTPVDMCLAEVARWSRQYPIQLAGRYACLETDQGLDVIDVSDPTRVTRAGRYLGQLPGEFQVVGDYGYFAAGPDGLQVINLADPLNPVRFGGFATGGGLVADQVRVVGNRAYLADRSALQILDVTDPGHPVRLGGVENVEHGFIAAMEVCEPYAYVAAAYIGNECCTNGFFVFDVSNAAAPVAVGSIIPGEPWWAYQIRILGDHAVVSGAREWERLMFFDVSNRAQPVQIPGLLLGEKIGGICLAGQYLYVACENFNNPNYSDERFAILDLSNPSNPVVIGRVPQGEGGGVDVAGHYAYVAVTRDRGSDQTLDGLEVFDISDPTMPVSVGGCEVAGIASSWPNCWPQFVQVQGQYAYLAVNREVKAELTVIDVKDPARPQPIGTYEFQGGGTGGASGWASDSFQVVGNLIYVAEGVWGLTILEVELPGTLKLKPPVLSGNTLTLTWNGGPGIRLQKTTSLTNPNWLDVSGSEGLSQIELPCIDAAAFFRLIKP